MWRHKRLQGIFCDRGSGGVEGESGATDADEATGLPRDGPPTQLRGTAVGMWDEAVEGEGEKAAPFFLPWNQVDLILKKAGQPFIWALLFRITAILKNQSDSQKQLNNKSRANLRLKNSAFLKSLTDLNFKFPRIRST